MSTAEQQSPQTHSSGPGEPGRPTTEGLTAEQIEKLRDLPAWPAPSDGERDRLVTGGQRTDDGGVCSLLLVHEADGDWTIQGPEAPGVRLSAVDMTSLAEAILARAR